MPIFGVHGRYLHVDLTTGSATAHHLPEAVTANLLGGTGLAAYLLWHWCPAGVEPLSPENPLILASSPFIGTGITTASKLVFASRSPQTGMIGDSLSSSYLAIALKRTGYDALVITGRADDAALLVIDDGAASLRPASHLRGLDPVATASQVRQELGESYRVAAIGQAGERLVRYAAIANDGRLAGRTGTGAVMGSKNLKAIAVRGSRLPAVADPKAVAAQARALAARSLGSETAKYRELGTAANLAFFSRIGILPTRNFRAGSFERADAISGETLFLEHLTDKNACAACTIGCEHHYRTTDDGDARTVRLEYESLFALGSLCGVADPNTVLRAAARCDDLGLDAISAGASIAWAMECGERGVDLGVPARDVPRFGDGAALLATIEAIGERRGLGDLLAEGTRRAAEIVGQGSDGWAMHVKGLELPGYDPRKLRTLALGLAVATRGACHNRSSAYDVDLSDRLDPDAETTARARAAIEAEDQAALLDSLTICKFLRRCFDDLYAESAALFTAVTGLALSGDDLRRASQRINTLKKLFNVRQGWTRAADTLPSRLFEPSGQGPGLDRAGLAALIDAYYRERGWDATGAVPTEQLDALGLTALLHVTPPPSPLP